MCDRIKKHSKELDRKKVMDINDKIKRYNDSRKGIREKLKNEFKSVISRKIETVESKKHKYKYKYVREVNDKYGRYYVGEGRIILDCDKVAFNKRYWNMNDFIVSEDEKIIIFTVDETGDTLHKIYMKGIFSGDIVEIKGHNGDDTRINGGVVLSKDGKIVYYISRDESLRGNELWSYEIEKDEYTRLYEEKDERYTVEVMSSWGEERIFMHVSSFNNSEVHEVLGKRVGCMLKRERDIIYSVDYCNNRWYILVNNKDKSYVITVDKRGNKKVVIENENGREISDIYVKQGYIIVFVKVDGDVILEIINPKGEKIRMIFLDEMYSVDIPKICNMNVREDELVLEYESFVRPDGYIIIDMNELEGITEIDLRDRYIYKSDILNYNINKYSCVKVNVNDKGLRITMLMNKEIGGENRKCVLYGYGAYGVSIEPYFSKYIKSLLDRGYIYCIAHVRGGGENGYKWYDGGKKLNKMNSMKDYIECAEYLINNGITRSDRLIARGRSAGGLLVGATINLRPDLFNLAIMEVPFVNVLSEMCDKSIPLTTGEYEEWGDPNNKKYFNYMSKYCPYNNINLEGKYPNILLVSYMGDTQVSYSVPLNYYLKMRNAEVFKNGNKDIYLDLKMEYGHGGSSDPDEEDEEEVDIYSMIIGKTS